MGFIVRMVPGPMATGKAKKKSGIGAVLRGELAYSTNDGRNFSRLGQDEAAAPWKVDHNTIFENVGPASGQIYPTAMRTQEDGSHVVYASTATVPHNYGFVLCWSLLRNVNRKPISNFQLHRTNRDVVPGTDTTHLRETLRARPAVARAYLHIFCEPPPHIFCEPTDL